jgi:hypothetical protein
LVDVRSCREYVFEVVEDEEHVTAGEVGFQGLQQATTRSFLHPQSFRDGGDDQMRIHNRSEGHEIDAVGKRDAFVAR